SEKAPGARTRSLHGSCDPPDAFLTGRPVSGHSHPEALANPCRHGSPKTLRSRPDPFPAGAPGPRPVTFALVRALPGFRTGLAPGLPARSRPEAVAPVRCLAIRCGKGRLAGERRVAQGYSTASGKIPGDKSLIFLVDILWGSRL